MTLLRSVLLAFVISFGLSAGTVIGDQFSMSGTFGSRILGTDVTSVGDSVFPAGSQSVSFGIGTNIESGTDQFPGDNLQVWIDNFHYICCGDFDLVVDAEFSLDSTASFPGWSASSAGNLEFHPLSFPPPSMTLVYAINPPPELGNANITTQTYSFTNSGPLGISNGALDFRFEISGHDLGNVSLPGQGFLLQTTPEPGGVLLLTAIIGLGFGARRWIGRKRG